MKEKEAETRPVGPAPDDATPTGDGALDDGQLDAVSGGVRHTEMTVTKKHDVSSGSL
jgi:hypothetical protein